MRYMEFGEAHKPAVMLIHAFGASWRMWADHIDALQQDYRVVVAVLDGHDEEDDSDFISLHKCATDIAEFVEQNCQGRLHAMCGVSLGGLVIAEVLSQNRIKVSKAIIDGAPILPVSKSYAMLSGFNFRLLAWLSRSGINLYRWVLPGEAGYHIHKTWARMSAKSIRNAVSQGFSYRFTDTFRDTATQIAYWYGSKEAFMMRQMAKAIVEAVPHTQVEVFPGYGHGETAVQNPDLYVAKAKEFFAK